MIIRPARSSDAAAIWTILEPIIRAGETYALPRDMTEEDAVAYWMGADKETFVAEEEGLPVGTYFLRVNSRDGTGQVANCAYMTAQNAMGRGVGRRMCEHSFEQARARGYRAMQFNLVVSTNERAVRLWQSLGFEIVGTLPGAFNHPQHGEVDAFVMYRRL